MFVNRQIHMKLRASLETVNITEIRKGIGSGIMYKSVIAN